MGFKLSQRGARRQNQRGQKMEVQITPQIKSLDSQDGEDLETLTLLGEYKFMQSFWKPL